MIAPTPPVAFWVFKGLISSSWLIRLISLWLTGEPERRREKEDTWNQRCPENLHRDNWPGSWQDDPDETTAAMLQPGAVRGQKLGKHVSPHRDRRCVCVCVSVLAAETHRKLPTSSAEAPVCVGRWKYCVSSPTAESRSSGVGRAPAEGPIDQDFALVTYLQLIFLHNIKAAALKLKILAAHDNFDQIFANAFPRWHLWSVKACLASNPQPLLLQPNSTVTRRNKNLRRDTFM